MAVPLSVLAGLACFWTAHVTLWRTTPANEPRISALLGLGLCGLLVTCGGGAPIRFDAISVCAAGSIYLACFVFYLFVYAGLSRSVSLTLLDQLARDRQEVRIDDLIDGYARSSRFEDRVRLLSEAGFLLSSGGRVRLTPKGRALARASKRIGAWLGGDLAG